MSGTSDIQFQKIADTVKDIVKFDDQNRAFESIAILNKYVKQQGWEKNNPGILNAYNSLIIQLKWVALPLLKEGEIVEMFSRNIAETFKMEYFDLWDKFKVVLVAVIMVHLERDKFKEKVRSALNKSQSILSSIKLESGDNPTVENWIKNYTANVGLNPVESLKLQGYFLNNSDLKKLKPEERDKVQKFFQFYEKLKLSSITVAGIEETVPIPIDEEGTMGYIRGGKIERDAPLPPDVQKIFDAVRGVKKGEEPAVGLTALKAATPKLKPEEEKQLIELKQTLTGYSEKSLERKAIEEEIKKLEAK